MKQRLYKIKIAIGCLLLIAEAVLFVYLDNYNYLHKGISVFDHKELPFNTRLRGDHNCSGFYYFSPTQKGGFSLNPNDIFADGVSMTPTVILSKRGTRDTIYISRLVQYGYTNDDLLVEVADMDNGSLWLQPVQNKGKKIYIKQILQDEFCLDDYHWVAPASTPAFYALLVYFLLIILFPITLVWIIIVSDTIFSPSESGV